MLSTVLLIDDDPTTNFLHERLLRRMGVSQEVLVASNGQRALELLRTHCLRAGSATCPALILLDLNMPVMDGLEFLEALTVTQLGQHPAVIVMLTSSQLDKDLTRFRHLPVADFLTKPLTQEKMAVVLGRYFDLPPVRA